MMPKVDDLVRDFMTVKSVAVVGVSDQRETGCNAVYERFRDAGYAVWPVNPHLSEFDGQPCYPDLRSIPERPEAVFILTNPNVTEEIVQQCVDLGVKRVWMHCLMGVKPGLAGYRHSRRR